MKKLVFFILILGLFSTLTTYEEVLTPFLTGSQLADAPPQVQGLTGEHPTIMMYNTQTLGRAKVSNRTELDILVGLIENQDFSILQEVRDVTNTTRQTLRQELHKEYEIHESERRGRTAYKESMFFIWNTSVFSVSEPRYYFEDPTDIYEREPYVVNVTHNGTWFYLVSTHVQPRNAEEEIEALLQTLSTYTDPYVLLGDLNADCSYYDASQTPTVKNTTWILPTGVDTTVSDRTCAYDRIITNNNSLFNGYAVYDKGQQISDHYPIATQVTVS